MMRSKYNRNVYEGSFIRPALIIWFFLWGFTSEAQMQKRALIIAIGDYPAYGGWHKLSSVNDVEIIKSALIQQGFPKGNIHVLLDEEATKKGILNAFEQLKNECRKGDIVYFHFSGHGQQIADDNGDEPDGLDEALIPYDAGLHYYKCPFKGENHLRDDLLGVLLDGIRKTIGPQGDLIVVLDACHSGTATRGIGISRGTEIIFAPPDFEVPNPIPVVQDRGFLEITKSEDLAPVVVISGSSAREQNREYNGFGSLSYAISHILPRIDKSSTYLELFEQIRIKMGIIVPQQNPQIEGNFNRQLFAGRAVEHSIHIQLKQWIDSENIEINAGRLNGVFKNALIEFIEIGSDVSKSNKILAEGRVVDSRLSSSIVKLNKPISLQQSQPTWAKVKEYSYDSFVVNVKIASALPVVLSDLIVAKTKSSQFVNLAGWLPDLLIDYQESPKKILTIITKDDYILYEESIANIRNDSIAGIVYQIIQQYAQAHLIRALESTNPALNLSLELIPVKIDASGRVISLAETATKKTASGMMIFHTNDHFQLRITNNGTRGAYFGILDIQPDNIINVLVPTTSTLSFQGIAPAECWIAHNQTIVLPLIFRIDKPYGKEVFKLIAAGRSLNLVPILQTRGLSAQNSDYNPFEQLFAESFDLLTRSGTNLRLPPESIHIHTVVFEIGFKE